MGFNSGFKRLNTSGKLQSEAVATNLIKTFSVFSNMKHPESYMETWSDTFSDSSLVYSLREKNASVNCRKLLTLLKLLVSNQEDIENVHKCPQFLELAECSVLLTPLQREIVKVRCKSVSKNGFNEPCSALQDRQRDRYVLTKHAMLT